MKRVLYINHKSQKCGVYEFGLAIGNAITKSKEFEIRYEECDTLGEFSNAFSQFRPEVVIYNYHPFTMPWISEPMLRYLVFPTYKFPAIHIGHIHEVYQEYADRVNNQVFDFHIGADPTLLLKNPIVFKTGRLIPSFKGAAPEMHAKPVIGSFGFAGPKQYVQIVEQVQREFDEAVIRINISFARYGDEDGRHAKAIKEELQAAMYKPGVELRVTHDHYDKKGLLDFLASNDLNVFCYKYQDHRGISSSTDWGLAVDRPLAINKCMMFRHLFDLHPTICIEDSSLKNILQAGTAPLEVKKREWTEENIVWDYNQLIRSSLTRSRSPRLKKVKQNLKNKIRRRLLGSPVSHQMASQSAWLKENDSLKFTGFANMEYTPVSLEQQSLNRILDNQARALYKPAIDVISALSPEIIVNKIPEANVQQGFVFDTAFRTARASKTPARILTVGAFEDTASLGLKKLGFAVEEIDPEINYDIRTFLTRPSVKPASYDIILSTSVIEHVADDEQFVRDIAYLLKPGGTAILTCDYHNDYVPGFRLPENDLRFYTKKDLTERLLKAIPDCSLVQDPSYDCKDYDFHIFHKVDYNYTFATFVFTKKQ